MARPSGYSKQIAEHICEHIAQGRALASWCRENSVSYPTVMRWLADDEAFQANYARAREASADADADAMSDLRDRVLSGEIDPQAARVAMDALKWSSGKRNPKRYGDKLAIGGDADAPPIQQAVTVRFVKSGEG